MNNCGEVSYCDNWIYTSGAANFSFINKIASMSSGLGNAYVNLALTSNIWDVQIASHEASQGSICIGVMNQDYKADLDTQSQAENSKFFF